MAVLSLPRLRRFLFLLSLHPVPAPVSVPLPAIPVCNICAGGSGSVVNPDAVLMLGVTMITCRDAQALGQNGEISTDACGPVQAVAESTCCTPEPDVPDPCDICALGGPGNGDSLVNPDEVIFVDGAMLTCQQAYDRGMDGEITAGAACSAIQNEAESICCNPRPTASPTRAPTASPTRPPTPNPTPVANEIPDRFAQRSTIRLSLGVADNFAGSECESYRYALTGT